LTTSAGRIDDDSALLSGQGMPAWVRRRAGVLARVCAAPSPSSMSDHFEALGPVSRVVARARLSYFYGRPVTLGYPEFD